MISPVDYKIISDNIGNDYSDSENIVLQLSSAYSNMMGVYTDDRYSFSPDIARKALWSSYQNYNAAMVSDPAITLNVVLALQNHVNTHYGDVNGFLLDNSIKVNQSFADLSASVGYTIDNGNIE